MLAEFIKKAEQLMLQKDEVSLNYRLCELDSIKRKTLQAKSQLTSNIKNDRC